MILTVKSNLDSFESPPKITFNIGEVEVYLDKKMPRRRISLMPGKEYTWKANSNKWHLYPKRGNIKIGQKDHTINLKITGSDTRVFALADSFVEDAVWSMPDIHCGDPPGSAIFVDLTSLPVGWHSYSFEVTGGSCSYQTSPQTDPTPAFVEIRPDCSLVSNIVYNITLTVYDSGGSPINITSRTNSCGP